MVIRITDVLKKYKNSIIALDNLTLSVNGGQIFGLVGPNGAGKSTLINIFANIISYDSGGIYIFGEKLNKNSFEYKRNSGFMLEKPTYIEKLTGDEFLQFAAFLYNKTSTEFSSRIEELLEFLDLEEKKDSLIETYSAGMKKKISFAAAIIHKPQLLILDEPLESIDPLSANSIKESLRLMAEKGTTVFLSSHNLDTVENICDEVAIINKGKIVFQSKTKDIRNKIKNDLNQETYKSLEEIFVDVVAEGGQKQKKKLSWL
jgi:ABC-2 type transport system ATP-binding protein